MRVERVGAEALHCDSGGVRLGRFTASPAATETFSLFTQSSLCARAGADWNIGATARQNGVDVGCEHSSKNIRVGASLAKTRIQLARFN